MNAIDPKTALQNASTELHMALTNGALEVGETVDAIDREHVEKAAVIIKMLLEAQR